MEANQKVPRTVAVCPRCGGDLYARCEASRDRWWRIVVDHATVGVECDSGHGPTKRKDAAVWGPLLDRVYGWLTDEEV